MNIWSVSLRVTYLWTLLCVWWGEELIGGGGSAWCLASAGWGADRGGRGIDGVNTAAPGLKEKACMYVCVWVWCREGGGESEWSGESVSKIKR